VEVDVEINYENRGEFLVIHLNVRRATADIAVDLKEHLLAAINSGTTNIIISLNYVEFVDSSFLGVLVAGLKQIKLKEGEIRIVGLHPHVRVTFELTRLDQMFPIYQTVEEAMRVE
jgi:anti-sigma B factor antagonist